MEKGEKQENEKRDRVKEKEGEREREDTGWFLHGEALASVVVVNPVVSLISRPTAIRFASALLCLFGRPGCDILSPSDLFFHNFHPFVRRGGGGGDGDGGRANGADRNSGGLGRKAIERRFRHVVARDGARRVEDDLSLFSLEPRDRDRNRILRIEFCE